MDRKNERESMVRFQIAARGVANERVLLAMLRVPREFFLPEDSRRFAYDDSPFGIGHGQTISQPYMVARVLELLDPAEGDKVLEVGSGSGYLAAVLAAMGAHVVGVERIEALALRARQNLDAAGVEGVRIIAADGRGGWPEDAPYDGIVVSAAARDIEKAWMAQIADGGRIVAPVEAGFGYEKLLVRRKSGNHFDDAWFDACRYVPLLSGMERLKDA